MRDCTREYTVNDIAFSAIAANNGGVRPCWVAQCNGGTNRENEALTSKAKQTAQHSTAQHSRRIQYPVQSPNALFPNRLPKAIDWPTEGIARLQLNCSTCKPCKPCKPCTNGYSIGIG